MILGPRILSAHDLPCLADPKRGIADECLRLSSKSFLEVLETLFGQENKKNGGASFLLKMAPLDLATESKGKNSAKDFDPRALLREHQKIMELFPLKESGFNPSGGPKGRGGGGD